MSEIKYVPYSNEENYRTNGYARLPESKELKEVDFVVAGIPFDTNVTHRPGARGGPKAIREAYSHDSYHTGFGIDIYEYLRGVDYGDIFVLNGDMRKSFDAITEETGNILKAGVTPIILGGDHSVTFPELLAYKEVYGPVSLIHFDSHTDTWGSDEDKEHYDHANPFRRAIEYGCINPETSIQVGMRGPMLDEKEYEFADKHGLERIYAVDVHRIGIVETARRIREKVGNTRCMVTFDIDFIDPQFAPGTGTPVPAGFSAWEAFEILRYALVGLDIKGFDLVEIAPNYDCSGITAVLGSQLVHEFIALIACKKAGITSYQLDDELNCPVKCS